MCAIASGNSKEEASGDRCTGKTLRLRRGSRDLEEGSASMAKDENAPSFTKRCRVVRNPVPSLRQRRVGRAAGQRRFDPMG